MNLAIVPRVYILPFSWRHCWKSVHLVSTGGLVDSVPVELEECSDGLPEDDHEEDDGEQADKFAQAANQR
jgi:hypothetical protein